MNAQSILALSCLCPAVVPNVTSGDVPRLTQETYLESPQSASLHTGCKLRDAASVAVLWSGDLVHDTAALMQGVVIHYLFLLYWGHSISRHKVTAVYLMPACTSQGMQLLKIFTATRAALDSISLAEDAILGGMGTRWGTG